MKRTSTLVGLVLTTLAVYAILSLISVRGSLKDAVEQTASLQAEIAAVQEENSALEEEIQDAESEEGTAELARQRLKLIKPNEIIFEDIS